ncbi:hypothetical protein PoB_002501300 [Plakobranchus ocellatus]|uniref:Uncharacterized protein n=1 Tax=Plakobranchus ocellatus TaxID=259542 RepID=A0AAV3ZUF4_9GAST|nr:hypothetical protein PoB_002501300 [Plakobranchus ocellatus]
MIPKFSISRARRARLPQGVGCCRTGFDDINSKRCSPIVVLQGRSLNVEEKEPFCSSNSLRSSPRQLITISRCSPCHQAPVRLHSHGHLTRYPSLLTQSRYPSVLRRHLRPS